MPGYSYIGRGKVFLSKRGDNKLRFVGNCDKVELSFTEETKEIKDYTQLGGGVAHSVSRIDKVELGLNLYDYSPENLAMSIFGEASVIKGGSVKKEEHRAYKGKLIRLHQTHISKAVVKDKESGSAYQENVDYEILSAGLLILEQGTIADNTLLSIDYDYGASDVIQALVNSGDEYRFVFDGLNEAQSGRKVVIEVYRVKFIPAASLSFLSDEFGSIEMTGIALSDASKTGPGISRFFKVEMEQAHA